MIPELRSDYMGKNSFVWWQGVVEDIKDPLKLGRVRVRVLGWHVDDKALIPTDSLPWASVVLPANSPFISGKGWSPNGLVQGCWVIGFFRDGMNSQEPVVIGSIGGVNVVDIRVPYSIPKEAIASYVKSRETETERLVKENRNDVDTKPADLPRNPMISPEMGFYDPDGIYPLISRMGEADTNRLARGECPEYTIVQKKDKKLLTVETAIGGKWSEPKSPYAAIYPFNHVYESQAGHVVEYDDTPGAERMHWYHCSGTFNEVHPEGGQVQKVVGNAWDITLKDKMIYIEGNASFNSGKTMKIMMGKDLEIEVGGDAKLLVKGNMTMDIGGDFLQKVKGKYTLASEGPMVMIAPRIDLNPIGQGASSIKTMLPEARSLVKAMIRSLSVLPEGQSNPCGVEASAAAGGGNDEEVVGSFLGLGGLITPFLMKASLANTPSAQTYPQIANEAKKKPDVPTAGTERVGIVGAVPTPAASNYKQSLSTLDDLKFISTPKDSEPVISPDDIDVNVGALLDKIASEVDDTTPDDISLEFDGLEDVFKGINGITDIAPVSGLVNEVIQNNPTTTPRARARVRAGTPAPTQECINCGCKDEMIIEGVPSYPDEDIASAVSSAERPTESIIKTKVPILGIENDLASAIVEKEEPIGITADVEVDYGVEPEVTIESPDVTVNNIDDELDGGEF